MPRESPLEPRRVMSIFKERVEKHKGELAELQLQEKLIEKEKPVIFFILFYFNSSIMYILNNIP